ncbi:MAG: Peptidoglycan glycosyltransferase [Chloroflexi bacterium]|nr:Peptidoglycan glycosyltransferase [Chloroflexota bacterium]
MLGRTDSRPRLALVLLVLLAFGVACFARLGYWQLGQRDMLVARARDQVLVRTEVPAVRGTIYDRSGTVVLATTVLRDRLAAYPAQIPQERRAAMTARLAAILRLDEAGTGTLRERLASGKAYVVLARELDEGQSAAIRAGLASGDLAQLALEAEQVRVYPQEGGAPGTSLAAHILGFVNREGVGQYGVEERWQEQLAGGAKVVLALRDAAGRPILEGAEVLEAGSPGADLVLTIDASLQLHLEQEVYATWVADKARSVSAVVEDPVSGEILAAASYPSYDANDYRAIAAHDPAVFMDPVVSTVYEPGSVFKMLTAAAVLENKTATTKTRFADTAYISLDRGRARIWNANKRGMGTITFADGVAYSRNVVMSRAALRLGKSTRTAASRLHGTWVKFGFGEPTGVDLAGELPGLVRDPAVETWRQVDLANGSFGQGVAVTLLQLANAYSAMVNDGLLPTPRVVRALGSTTVVAPEARRATTPAVARQLVRLMKYVVTEVPWYRDRTRVTGYVVGGKTGTAEIWDAKAKRWKAKVFNHSFIGFIGRTGPELVVAVRINEGTLTVIEQGNLEMPVESFELFRRVATDAVSTLGIPRATKAASPSPGASP